MSLAEKTKLGDETPALYTFYGKQYKFDDFLRLADQGLSEYLKTLKRGSKDELEFRKAYLDIMSGIKDGTITYDNGRYIDSTGRRTNLPKKNKDYYGLMASYIYSKLGKSGEYTKSSKNPKWEGSSSAGKWLVKDIFGSETPNLNYFIELDPYNEETKTRGLDKRSALALNAMRKLYKGLYTDNSILFEGLSDLDKASYKSVLEAAINNAEKNGIGKDDYLSFTKAFGDLEYDKWFSTLQVKDNLPVKPEQRDPRSAFSEWARSNHPLPSRDLNTLQITTGRVVNGKRIPYEPQYEAIIDQTLSELDDNSINELLVQAMYGETGNLNAMLGEISGKDYNISSSTALHHLLNSLKSRNLLKQLQNDYFHKIPSMDGVSLKWNGNTIQEIADWDNPFLVLSMLNEYRSSVSDDYSPYFAIYDRLTSHKQGGILKALTGIKVRDTSSWYLDVFMPLLDHILKGLDSDKNYYTWLNDMLDRHSELYRAAIENGKDFYNTAYRDNSVGEYLNKYKEGYNHEWDGNPSGYNSLGILNALTLGAFDIFGSSKRNSGDWNGNGNEWKTDNLYSAITDYRRLLGRDNDFTDEQLQLTVNAFKEKGYEFIKDANGYYKLRPVEQAASETPKETPKESSTNPSNIYQTTEKEKKTPDLEKTFLELLPSIIGAGRLFESIRTNNKVAKALRKSLNPVLENTYERYSPITGAFSEMQFRNRLAAGVRRKASNPFTSDASLLLAGLLDANRLATDLEYQGFLADDKEIARTAAEALARQEDNMARRSAVANKNRLSINLNNREIAQLEATRLKQNWLSLDNFLQESFIQAKNRLDLNKLKRAQSLASQISWDYQDEVLKAELDWEREHPNGTNSDKLKDPTYMESIRKARRARDTALLDILYAKRGGSFRPSTVYLINKVIRNESNT